MTGRTKAPISSHPVFPAIVALWFAALLGFGSMVLPVALLEELTTATGLPSVLPAAQAPLGATARILITLTAAGLGVVAGLYVARKVVAGQAAHPRRHSPMPDEEAALLAKRPISARDEIDVEKLDVEPDAAVPAITVPQRPLSVIEDHECSEGFEFAPLPGCDDRDWQSPADDPLDLDEFADDDHCAPASDDTPGQFGTEPATDRTPDWSRSEDSPGLTGAPHASTELSARPLHELGIAELVERFAQALQRHVEAEVGPEAQDNTLELPKLRTDCPNAVRQEAIEEIAPATAEAPRLAALHALGGGEAEDDEEAENDDQGYSSLLAMKSPLGASREFVRIDDDADEIARDDGIEPVVEFPGQQLQRRAVPASDGPSRDPFSHPKVAQDGFRPVGKRADTGETERALREALEKLQKISGAA